MKGLSQSIMRIRFPLQNLQYLIPSSLSQINRIFKTMNLKSSPGTRSYFMEILDNGNQNLIKYHTIFYQITKCVTMQGLLTPVDILKLKTVNNQLNELKLKQTETSSIKIDKNLVFQSALKLGEFFPNLNLIIFNEQQKQHLTFQKGEITILRSWNLGEQMLNFERMVDYVKQLSIPNMKFRLIGIIRGTEDQNPTYEQAITYNRWNDYQQISLIQDGNENDGFLLDIDYDQQTNSIEKGNVLSCLLIDGDGRIIYKRYENELSFASDVDEVEQELEQYLLKQEAAQLFNPVVQSFQQAISRGNYRSLKKLIISEIQQEFQNTSFTRQLVFEISKEVCYKNSQKIGVSIFPPIIQIQSSIKIQEQVQHLIKMIRGKLSQDMENDINLINWDKKFLLDKLTKLIKENDLKVQVQMEKVLRICVTNQQILIANSSWEQSSLIPVYQETSCIQQIKQWLITRDILLPRLQQEINQSKQNVDKKISEICFNFFRSIPGVSQVLNKPFGGINYAERRKPPYEDLAKSMSAGYEEIHRDQNKILMIFLIDYENEDSVAILKGLMSDKEAKKFDNLQIVVLGHIRAESWTKLFQAFVEHHKIAQSIERETIETWFPIEDKISSLSFLGILGKIYGMQLEKKDIMLVGLDDRIVYLNSSRRFKTNSEQILKDIASNSIVVPVEQTNSNNLTQWQNLKKFMRQTKNLDESCKKMQAWLKDDEDIILLEQKHLKIWDFSRSGEAEFSQNYQQPTLKIKGSEELKKQTNSLLLQEVYKFVPQSNFDTR